MLKHERENLLSFTSDVNDSNTQESLFKKSAEGVSGHGCSYMPRVSQAKGWRNKEMFAQIDKIITAIDNAVWGLPLICLIMATGIFLTARLGLVQIRHLGKAFKFMFKDEEDGS